ncbi:unnamed protein product, partial [Mesorhabditis belari]|uniref:C-type lectin domain-containing protein n=1 Tax=Mesorhabditis belari TaxID=2138241 RepID=A0AAF3EX25_9BILA
MIHGHSPKNVYEKREFGHHDYPAPITTTTTTIPTTSTSTSTSTSTPNATTSTTTSTPNATTPTTTSTPNATTSTTTSTSTSTSTPNATTSITATSTSTSTPNATTSTTSTTTSTTTITTTPNPCPNGGSLFQGLCLSFVYGNTESGSWDGSWDSVANTCHITGGQLISIYNEETQHIVKANNLKPFLFSKDFIEDVDPGSFEAYYWIGLRYDKSVGPSGATGVWQDGNHVKCVDFNENKQYHNYIGFLLCFSEFFADDSLCLVMYRTGVWRNSPCWAKNRIGGVCWHGK